MKQETPPRISMLSIPARWGELYYTIFAVLCVAGEAFLVWYEVNGLDASSSVADTAMRIILGVAPVGVGAALAALIILKVRDTVMMTWETFAARREERGRKKGREEGRAEILAKIGQILPNENGSSVREDTDDLETLISRIIENPDALAKLRAMLREMENGE